MTASADIGRPRESCEQCGFDSDLYDRADTLTSQWIVPAVLRAAVDGLDDDVLQTRPDEASWSIAEHVDHVRETAFDNRLAIAKIAASPGIDLGPSPEPDVEDEPKPIDVPTALAGLVSEFDELQTLLSSLDLDRWNTTCKLAGETVTLGWFARHALHDGLHHLADVGRIRFGAGHGASTAIGSVSGLHISSGGVPKASVDSVVISPSGVEGDRQNDRRHHGRPIQAVCLWSADVIDSLRAEGHPIHSGAAGENLTLRDVAWGELRPGARIDVGSVELLISAHAIPCAKNAQWFSDRDFNRICHDRHPGWSRLYAIPLTSGTVTVGDRVTIEP